MDPLDREMLDQQHATKMRVLRLRFAAYIGRAVVPLLFVVSAVTGVRPPGWSLPAGAAAALVLGAVVLLHLAVNVRTDGVDDELTVVRAETDDQQDGRRAISGELDHLRGLARLQVTYITAAVAVLAAGIAVALIYAT